MNDFNKQIIDLAREQQRVTERNAIAQAMRQRFFDQYVKAYDDEMAANEAGLEAMRKSIKQAALDYVVETGDLDPHPAITFRRTTKLMYDKDEALKQAKEKGAAEFIRVQESLDVRKFEAAVKKGDVPWIDSEEVNVPSIALDSKLGAWLIQHEVEQGEQS